MGQRFKFPRQKPKKPCEFMWEADFGYGPTEYHYCGAPATHVVKGLPFGDKARACEAHAVRFREDVKRRPNLKIRVYRFRKVVAA
jgi:hypothetical protein